MKKRILKVFLFIISVSLITFGTHKLVNYVINYKELERIQNELTERENEFEASMEAYEKSLEEEKSELAQNISEVEEKLDNLDSTIKELPITGVGDSIMLGALYNLQKQFPKGHFDAKVSRSIWVADGILKEYKSSNQLGNPVVINLGANGDCTLQCKLNIINTCADREIFWLTVTNDKNVQVNAKLKDLATKYENFHVIDWEKISSSHKEYFYADGIHLDIKGRTAYTQAIYDNIKETYQKKYAQEIEKLKKEYLERQRNKIGFYGDETLFYAFANIRDTFSDSIFHVTKRYDYNSLKEDVEKALEQDTLSNRIVLSFDDLNTQYEKVFDLLGEREIYVLTLTEKTSSTLNRLNRENIHEIKIYKEIEANPDYLLKDGKHLSKSGNEALVNTIKKTIEKEELEE